MKFYNDKYDIRISIKKICFDWMFMLFSKDYRVARLSINYAKFKIYKTIPNNGRIDLNYRTASHNIVSNPE